jgi:hypothetical protein
VLGIGHRRAARPARKRAWRRPTRTKDARIVRAILARGECVDPEHLPEDLPEHLPEHLPEPQAAPAAARPAGTLRLGRRDAPGERDHHEHCIPRSLPTALPKMPTGQTGSR